MRTAPLLSFKHVIVVLQCKPWIIVVFQASVPLVHLCLRWRWWLSCGQDKVCYGWALELTCYLPWDPEKQFCELHARPEQMVNFLIRLNRSDVKSNTNSFQRKNEYLSLECSQEKAQALLEVYMGKDSFSLTIPKYIAKGMVSRGD